jgi:hypothetical protein
MMWLRMSPSLASDSSSWRHGFGLEPGVLSRQQLEILRSPTIVEDLEMMDSFLMLAHLRGRTEIQ